MLVAFSSGDAVRYLLAFFLLVVGLGLGWALIALASTFARLASFLRGAESEILPVINKVGGSVDRVNGQLDKLDQATDSARRRRRGGRSGVRTVSFAVKRPVREARRALEPASRTAARRCALAATGAARCRAARRPPRAARPTSRKSIRAHARGANGPRPYTVL